MSRSDAERVYSPIDENALATRLDRSLSPRAPGMLLDRAVALGLGPGDLLLDVGGRDGKHARKLVERTSCRALVADVVAANLKGGLLAGGAPVTFVVASIEDLPVGSGTCRLVLCRDMLIHIDDLPRAMGECARVLTPGGHLLVHNTFATDLLEPLERSFLVETLGVVAANLTPAHVEHAFRGAGLELVLRDVIASEWREHDEESGDARTSKQLLRIARMRRDRAALVADLGENDYAVELADCLWGVYQMLGKLAGIVYTLHKP
jgi:SAM-dependent methyltransferase